MRKQAKNKLIKKGDKMPRSMKKYEAIRDELDTGDIVLFSGSGFISKMIQWKTHSEFSHVAMVVKIKEWDMLLLFESTTLSKIKDIESRKQTQGVQLVPLSERIKCYDDDKVVFRKLEGVERSPEMRKIFREFRKEVKGRHYEESKWELFCSAYDFIGGQNEEDLSSLFCSELIAEMYERWYLFIGGVKHKDYIPSNERTPADFSGKVELCSGYLGDYIRV